MVRRLLVAEVVSLFVVLGCNPPERSRGEVELNMYTWWTVGGEKEALDVLKTENQKRHPNVTVKTNEAKNAEASFAKLDAELKSFSPPDTFQANGGSKLLSRVIFDNDEGPSTEPSRLKPIDDVFEEAGTRIWDILEPLIGVDGTRYGVPLNVHRINNLYFSVPKLSKVWGQADGKMPYETLKSRLPTNLEGFFDLLKETGDYWNANDPDDDPDNNRPMGLGVADIWTLEELAFENLMPSIALSREALGPVHERQQFFEKYWNGTRDPRSPVVHQIIEDTLIKTQDIWKFIQRFDPQKDNSSAGKWSEPFDKLMDPTSAVTFVVMGDWATGYLNEKKKRAKDDYGVVPFPGTEKLFIFTSDTLPLTLESRHPEETKDFLTTALTKEAQFKFNAKKGSVPALRIADPADLEQLTDEQRETLLALRDDSVRKSLAMSGTVTPDVEPDLYRKALKAMLDEQDRVYGRDLVHHTLENYYWMLTLWTVRLNEATPSQ